MFVEDASENWTLFTCYQFAKQFKKAIRSGDGHENPCLITRAVASMPDHLHFLIGFTLRPINPVDSAEEDTVETLNRFIIL